MIIQYCDKCSRRVDEEELTEGALRVDENRVLCAKCAIGIEGRSNPRKSSSRHAPVRLSRVSTAHVAPVHAVRKPTHSGALPQPRSAGGPLFVGLLCGVLIAGIAVAVFVYGSPFSNALPARGALSTAPLHSASENKPSVVAPSLNSPTAPQIGPRPKYQPEVPVQETLTREEKEKAVDKELAEYRAGLAQTALIKLKRYREDNPADPWGYHDQLVSFLGRYRTTPAAAEGAELLAAFKPPDPSQPGYILREVWYGVGSTSLVDLRKNLNFPNLPSDTSRCRQFELPTDIADQYGTRLRGYILPPTTGEYTFWLASDDNSELWLSSTDKPQDRVKIASVPEHTGFHEWGRYPQQKSKPVTLTAGKRYYIEALQKEEGGQDHLSVMWQLPSGEKEEPIPGKRTTPFMVDDNQLVSDSGFDGLEGWHLGKDVASVEHASARSGKRCLRLGSKDSDGAYQIIKVKPNTSYTLRAWGKSEGVPLWIGVQTFRVNDFSDKICPQVVSGEWTEITFEFTTGPKNTSANVFAWKDKGSKAAYVDDFTVTPKTP